MSLQLGVVVFLEFGVLALQEGFVFITSRLDVCMYFLVPVGSLLFDATLGQLLASEG